MVRALRSKRTGRLLTEWRQFLNGLEEPSAAVGPAAEYPVGQLANARIAKVYKRIVKAGKRIDDSSPPQALHQLRKQCKELRYLLELFASLYPAHVTKPMLRALRALQEMLGRFQDREIQAQLIRSLGEEVRTLDDGAAALLAMGQLVDRVEEQQAEARARVHRALRGVRVEPAACSGAGDVHLSRVLATYNIKGGVGKTSAAVNLAYLAAQRRCPDAAVGPRPAGREHLPVPGQAEGEGRRAQARARQDRRGRAGSRAPTTSGSTSCRPTSPTATWTSRWTSSKKPTRRMGRVLAPLQSDYDYIFLDCPPSISLVSENVFEAADALLVPLIPATLSSRTFDQLERVVERAARRSWRSSRWSTAARACTAR